MSYVHKIKWLKIALISFLIEACCPLVATVWSSLVLTALGQTLDKPPTLLTNCQEPTRKFIWKVKKNRPSKMKRNVLARVYYFPLFRESQVCQSPWPALGTLPSLTKEEVTRVASSLYCKASSWFLFVLLEEPLNRDVVPPTKPGCIQFVLFCFVIKSYGILLQAQVCSTKKSNN